jgi:hypothetical protein
MPVQAQVNTLNLVGDGDELDILKRAETLFGVALANAEVEAIRTVGELFDVIDQKMGAHHTRACLTQAAFYRLRRALRAMGCTALITPETPLADALQAPIRGSSLRAVWRDLAAEADMKLPDRELSRAWLPTWLRESMRRHPIRYGQLGIVAVVGLPVFLAAATGSRGFVAIIAAVASIAFAFAMHALLVRFFGIVPARLQTLGDLAREAAGRSFESLRAEKHGFSPQDRWWAVMAILRDNSSYAGPIDRETTFFAKA